MLDYQHVIAGRERSSRTRNDETEKDKKNDTLRRNG